MSWNVFDNQDGVGDVGPPMVRYSSVLEPVDITGLFQNEHRIPLNDGFEHETSKTCPCNPSFEGKDEYILQNTTIFHFLHIPQGEAR